MINLILEVSKKDKELWRFLERVKEYAEVYTLAKNRQKGCDGMGEVATLRDEFNSVLEELINYCRQKGYIVDNILLDVDNMAEELLKIRK